MHDKKTYLISIVLLFFAWLVQAGVVILAEVPDALKLLLVKAQEKVQEYVDQNNKQSQQQYLFEKNEYAHHLTLAYLTNQELNLQQLEDADPILGSSLMQLAAQTPPLLVTTHLNESGIMILPGKFERNFGGKTYKKYAILTLKINATAQLVEFIQLLDSLLANHPIALKRVFPFNPHITIGYIYDTKDSDPCLWCIYSNQPLNNALQNSRFLTIIFVLILLKSRRMIRNKKYFLLMLRQQR